MDTRSNPLASDNPPRGAARNGKGRMGVIVISTKREYPLVGCVIDHTPRETLIARPSYRMNIGFRAFSQFIVRPLV
jgi:hypothetical protein